MDISNFYMDVYNVVKEIPYGKVISYGQIARLVGKPQYSRMVGRAMFHTPENMQLPSHRVVNSQGRLVPGWTEQYDLLVQEGVIFKKNGCVNLKASSFLWQDISI